MLNKLMFWRKSSPAPVDPVVEMQKHIDAINDLIPKLPKGHHLWVERDGAVHELVLCKWEQRAPTRVWPKVA